MKKLIAILAACALPLAAAGCSDDDPANSVPDDVEAVVNDYIASWNNYDAEAFAALVTDDYMFIDDGFGAENTKDQQMSDMPLLDAAGWHADVIGDMIAADDGTYYVAVTNSLTTTNGGEAEQGISVVTVVDEGGVLLVQKHTYTGARP